MSVAKIIACGVALSAIGLPETRAEQASSPTYSITDVGTLGGGSSVAIAINENGQIVGSADTPQGHRHAYIWENGVMTDLGTVPGGVQSEAADINNLGQVVGFSGRYGVMWWQGEVIDLGNFPGGPFGPTSAKAINDAGQVVGRSYNGTETHAFLWEDGVMTDLGTLGGGTTAWDGISVSPDMLSVCHPRVAPLVGRSCGKTGRWRTLGRWAVGEVRHSESMILGR